MYVFTESTKGFISNMKNTFVKDMKKQQKGTQVAIVFLCLLSMLVTLMSCTPKKETPNQTGTDPVERNTDSSFDAVRDIPGKILDRDFTVLSSFELGWLEAESTGDKVETVIYRRTQQVEEKYGIDLYIANAAGSVYPSLQAAYMSNDKSFDLVFPHPTDSMVTIMTSGYYANLTGLDSMDLSKPWYNSSQVQNYTTPNDKLYIVTPDISITSQGFFCLVYNRELYGKFNFTEDITEIVNNGEWTAEKFNEFLTVTDFSLDGEPLGNETLVPGTDVSFEAVRRGDAWISRRKSSNCSMPISATKGSSTSSMLRHRFSETRSSWPIWVWWSFARVPIWAKGPMISLLRMTSTGRWVW